MNSRLRFLIVLSLGSLALVARATDTTPPTLNINATWIEKSGSVYHFKMLLDPFDDVGVDHIEFRDALNTTGAVPASVAWATYPWTRGQPLDEGFICTALSLEVRAVDAAGNKSAVQKRTFKAPFPITAAPNQDPVFSQPPLSLTFSGPSMDCKGLFSADFNGDGLDDTVQFDNATGFIKVRVQNTNGTFSSQVITLTAGTIQDGAIGDFDKDGKMDILVVVNNDVVEYHNDGNNVSSLPTFSAITPPGRTGAGVSTVTHVAIADLNGDGYPEALLVGTGDDGSGGSIVKLEMLANDGAGSLHGYNDYLAPTNMSADRIALGDLTGDGLLDVAMISKTGRHIVIFKGLGNGLFGGNDDATTANRPTILNTYFAAEAIAIGDLAGRGLNDLVVTEHFWGLIPADPWNDGQKHNAQFWEMFVNDKVNGLQTVYPEYLAVGPVAPSDVPFNSDIMIRDYTGDRLPELVMTSEFDNGVRTVRLDLPLDNQNHYQAPYTKSPKVFTAAPHPQRLAHARLGSHTRDDLVVASGDTKQISWFSNVFNTTSKTYDIIGGANTDSDPNGTADTSGKLSYNVYPSGTINYSLTYVNNTAAAITGATVSITLPSALTFLSGDTGNTVTTSGTSHIVSWTTDIPANSAGVRNLSVQVGATTPLTSIAPTMTLKKGSSTLASATMPKVNVREPLLFTLVTSSDNDPSGLTVHTGEAIKYEFNLTNNSATAITNVKFGTAFPSGTRYIVESTPPGGTTFVKRGTVGKETGIDWTIATLPAHGLVSVFVLVEVTAAELATITESTATCTRGTFKIIAPTFKTTVSRSLEVILTKDVGIARPGDVVHYSFTVHNWSLVALNNAKLVMLLPQGMSLLSYNTDDSTGNFVGGTLSGDSLSATSNPAIDTSGGPTLSTLKWSWTSYPARAYRYVNFTCQVKWDDPLEYLLNGTHVTNAVSIYEYNFLGSLNTTGARVYAAAPVSTSSSATTLQQLSTKVPNLSTALSGEPGTPPKLALQKIALADGLADVAGEKIATVVNDSTVATDGFFTYALTVSNGRIQDPAFPNDPTKTVPAGPSTKLVVQDFLPTGANFAGGIMLDGTTPPSHFGYRYYDASGKEITGVPEPFTDTNGNGKWDSGEPYVDADSNGNYSLDGQYLPWDNEPFTDTNGNGKWDSGEPYTDTNGNHKYDSVTSVRRISFPLATIAGDTVHVFSYKVQATLAAGGTIISNSGGMAGKSGQYTFDPVVGYHLTAPSLNFPVNGGPLQLKVLVTTPAKFDLPGGIIKSRGNLSGTETTGIGIPFAVLGGTGINTTGVKMEVPIPKGYEVLAAQLLNAAGSDIGGATFTKNSAGVTTVSFSIDALRNATALFKLALDPATQSVLKNASGQIIAPLSIKPTVTGSYTKVTVPPPAPLARSLAAPPPPAPVSIPSLIGLGALPVLADPAAKDAKVFVGRCAPSIVRRGDNVTIVIFVGNLTDRLLVGGTIKMKVPTGTTFVSASHYDYNFDLGSGLDSGPPVGSNLPAGIHSGSTVTWNIGGLSKGEGGVVSMTVNVPATFAGNRIDDNSCTFDCSNAGGKSPGPMGIVVLNGNETAQGVAALQAAVEGTGVKFNDDVRNSLKNFHINSTSMTLSTGGCDIMALKNDVLLIPLNPGADRIMVLGPPSLVAATGTHTADRTAYDSPTLRILVGPGTLAGGMAVGVSTLPGLSGVPTVTPNSILTGLSTNGLVNTNGGNIVAAGGGNIVAAGGGNIVAAGGGNIVAAGGGNLIGSDSASLLGTYASKLILPEGIAALLAKDIGGNLVGSGGSSVVAAGGGNVVAAGGGNVVAAGAGNLIGSDSASLIGHDGASIVAAGAGNLIGQDSASVVAAGAGNIISAGAGNLVNNNGVASLANVK